MKNTSQQMVNQWFIQYNQQCRWTVILVFYKNLSLTLSMFLHAFQQGQKWAKNMANIVPNGKKTDEKLSLVVTQGHSNQCWRKIKKAKVNG